MATIKPLVVTSGQVQQAQAGDTIDPSFLPPGGADGGALTLRYVFSSTTTDSDPGSGHLRLDNSTQESATNLFISDIGSDGSNYSAAIQAQSSPFGVVGTPPLNANLIIRKATDYTKWLLFNTESYVDASGYTKVALIFLANSGTNPFTNGDAVIVSYSTPSEDGSDGHTGSAGAAGANGQVSIEYTWDSGTGSNPPTSTIRHNNATVASATTLYLDSVDILGVDWSTMLPNMFDEVTTQYKAFVFILNKSDFTKWVMHKCTAFVNSSGYFTLTITDSVASVSTPFANGDPVLVSFNFSPVSIGDLNTTVAQVRISAGTLTWTKYPNTKFIQFFAISGGGGGGSGRKGAAGSIRGGGGGGGGGELFTGFLTAGNLGSTETIFCGAAGTGGAAVSANSTNGNPGTAGGSSGIGAFVCFGGNPGGGGTSAGGGAGGTGGMLYVGGGAGGAGGNGVSAGAAGTSTTVNSAQFCTGAGGGGGGGISAVNVASAGGAGGSSNNGFTAGGTAGTTTPTSGGNGSSPFTPTIAGSGGGGGGTNSASASTARNGGIGGGYGGGGGGGGAGVDSVANSGAGGDGLSGSVLVITYF